MAKETMRAFVLHGHGGFDQLRYHEDWVRPVAGSGEVLIRVEACGLNNTDVNTRTGWYSDEVKEGITEESASALAAGAKVEQGGWSGKSISFPRIQGADVAGVIEAVGEGVSKDRVGERVIVDGWILSHGDWLNGATAQWFGSECDGGFAEYTVIRSENAIRVESDLSSAELAAFPCGLITAENLVMKSGLQAGETVVIAGASGGVGSYAIQLSCLRGARVIALANPAKADALKKLGAYAVVNSRSDNLEAEIVEAAGGAPQVALDVVGAHIAEAMIKALAYGGRYCSSGAIGGPMMEFDLRWLAYKDLQMIGATIVKPGTMARLAKLIDRGQVKPILAATYPLKELIEAQKAFLAKKHTGNIVVICKE